MKATQNWKRILPCPAIFLSICLSSIIAMSTGCKDLTSQNDAPALDTISSKTAESTKAASSQTPDSEQRESAPISPVREQVGPKKSVALPATKPSEIYEPKVILSASHEKTCLVNVGDVLPNLTLQTDAGEMVSLDDFRGDSLTVVVFWTNRLAFGRAQFHNLAAEVARPFRHLDVNVVAVNVGDPLEQIEQDEETRDEVVCLLDPDGSAIAKVATTKLPRTYLVDAEGRILWFDVEYSRTTRRQLKNAIFYHSRDETLNES